MICLRLGSFSAVDRAAKKIVFPCQKRGQIAIDLLGEALKNSKGFEKASPDDQYHFLFHSTERRVPANYHISRVFQWPASSEP